MTMNDIITPQGIDKGFMDWLWNKDRQTFTLIMFGHLELITEELVKEYSGEVEE